MKRKIPNLFLVGSMKSGTTTLHNYLGEHPEIFMSPKPWKETRYFVEELNWNKGEEWYLSLFENAGDVKFIGESSTDYTKKPLYENVPQRIASFNPDSYILYIMRDPIERSISHYWWEVRWSGEGRDMLTAIKKVRDICDVSYYVMQIKPYIDTFGKDRVFALTLEELSSNPMGTLEKIFQWLDIKTSFVPSNTQRKYNIQLEKIPTVRGSLFLSQFRGTGFWEWIKKTIPVSTRNSIRNFLSRPVEKDLSYVSQTIEYLRPIQQKQTEELSILLGRDFTEWKTLYNTQNITK